MDLNKLSSTIKQQAIKLGKSVGSSDTKAQAAATIAASTKWEQQMRDAGWRAIDHDNLVSLHAMLVDEESARGATSEANQNTTVQLQQERRQLKQVRRDALEDLKLALRDARMHAAPEQEEELEQLGEQLGRLGEVGHSALKLAGQLDTLHTVAAHPLIAAALADRGKDQLGPAIAQAAADCRKHHDASSVRRSTSAHTERLDLIDGLIVQYARDARKIARRIARDTGSDEIARDFELTHI